MNLKKNLFLLLISLSCLMNKDIKGAAEEHAPEKAPKKIIHLGDEDSDITDKFLLLMRCDTSGVPVPAYIPSYPKPFYIRLNSDAEGKKYRQLIPVFGYDEKTRSNYIRIPEGHTLWRFDELLLKNHAHRYSMEIEKDSREVPESLHFVYDPVLQRMVAK